MLTQTRTWTRAPAASPGDKGSASPSWTGLDGVESPAKLPALRPVKIGRFTIIKEWKRSGGDSFESSAPFEVSVVPPSTRQAQPFVPDNLPGQPTGLWLPVDIRRRLSSDKNDAVSPAREVPAKEAQGKHEPHGRSNFSSKSSCRSVNSAEQQAPEARGSVLERAKRAFIGTCARPKQLRVPAEKE